MQPAIKEIILSLFKNSTSLFQSFFWTSCLIICDWYVQVAAHSNVTFEIITLEEVGRRSMDTMTMDDDEMATAYSTMNSSGTCSKLLSVN